MAIKVDDSLKEDLSNENLKIEIDTALTKCNELEDENQRNIFKAILKALQFMMGNGQSYALQVEDIEIEVEDAPEYVQKLCKATKMNADDLEYVFNFKDENLELATTYGDSWEEKQLNAALCILTANYYCGGNGEITSSSLVEEFNRLKMGSMANLSRNLGKYKHFIDREGEPRGKKVYRIKGPGKKEGLAIIKKIILLEKGENVNEQ